MKSVVKFLVLSAHKIYKKLAQFYYLRKCSIVYERTKEREKFFKFFSHDMFLLKINHRRSAVVFLPIEIT